MDTEDGGNYQQNTKRTGKQHNVLPLWGNESTMNLNPLILANIQGSSYFKVSLFKLKTYHEVVDEIYYQVKHLEPWERGSRKTAGQTGMCGGVRGVGAGGIVSTAFCLLYKLYTLRLTRKQVNGLLTHTDSPYIRALGFMYIRFTQPPSDLYEWYEPYLQDDEEVDVKAGGGQTMLMGQMLHQFMVKLDWFSTLFPRIPVPIQKQIEQKLNGYSREHNYNFQTRFVAEQEPQARGGRGGGRDQQQFAAANSSSSPQDRGRGRGRGASPERRPRVDERRMRSRSREQVPSRDNRTDRDREQRDRSDRNRRGGGSSGGSADYYRGDRERSRERKDSYSRASPDANAYYSSSGGNRYRSERDRKHR